MTMLTEEQLDSLAAEVSRSDDHCGHIDEYEFARAIESVVAAPLLAQIAALEATISQRVPDAQAQSLPAIPDELCDDDLSELAHSANQEALSFGLSHDVFLRYFKTIRNRALSAAPAAPE